jgi:hypothetical protein
VEGGGIHGLGGSAWRRAHHFARTPSFGSVGERPLHRDATRSLHAGGAVAPGDTFRMGEVGNSAPYAVSPFRRPRSVAATARVRMGMRDGRKAPGVVACWRICPTVA